MKQTDIELLCKLLADYKTDDGNYLIGDYVIAPNKCIDGYHDEGHLLVQQGKVVLDLSNYWVDVYSNDYGCITPHNLFGRLLSSEQVYENLINAIHDLRLYITFDFHSCDGWVSEHYHHTYTTEAMHCLVSVAKSYNLDVVEPVFATQYDDNGEIACNTVTGEYVIRKPNLEIFQYISSLFQGGFWHA